MQDKQSKNAKIEQNRRSDTVYEIVLIEEDSNGKENRTKSGRENKETKTQTGFIIRLNDAHRLREAMMLKMGEKNVFEGCNEGFFCRVWNGTGQFGQAKGGEEPLAPR